MTHTPEQAKHPGTTVSHRRTGVASRYSRISQPETLAVLRRIFHQMNRGMVLLWRLGLGRSAGIWPKGFGRLLVIEHVGRRSGKGYRTPVNFTVLGDDLYCVAAFGSRTDWYRNALAQPRIVVWLPDGAWKAIAADASDVPDRLHLIRLVLIDSGFAAPLFGLHPRRMSDAELVAATSDYRLLRIQPQVRALNGPGDLAWVWLGLGALLLWRWARRP